MPARLMEDIRTALRGLRRAPGTTVAVALMLGLATGVNLAMLNLLERGLLAPPRLVTAPEEVHAVGFEVSPGAVMSTTSGAVFNSIRRDVDGVADTAAWLRTETAAMVGGDQIRVSAVAVSGRYFPLLGARPRLGHGLEDEDDGAKSGVPGAVLSHAFWRSAFGGDPTAVGRPLSIGGTEYVVTGIMPPAFSGHSADRTDLWIPLGAVLGRHPWWTGESTRNVVSLVVRLTARGEVIRVSGRASAALDRTVHLTPITGTAGRSALNRRMTIGLAALSGLVLAIALANAATLLLVRGSVRQPQWAIHAALGASRRRLLGVVTWEAVLLSTLAAAVSLGLATWAEELLRRVYMPDLVEGAGPAPRTVQAAALAWLLTAIVATVAGAVHASGSAAGVLTGARATPGGHRAVQRGLLVAQVTVCVLLLAAVGLFGRSLLELRSQDFGFRLDDVVIVSFPPGPQPVAGRDALFAAGLDRIRALPGVAMATAIQTAPFTGHHVVPISVPGLAEPPKAGEQLPYLVGATPEYFDIMGIPIVDGRGFTAEDDRGAPVAIVNRSMARAAWPGESALGKCIRIGFDPDFDPFAGGGPPPPPRTVPCREIVGVAADVRQRSVLPADGEDRLLQYYVPFSQIPGPPAGIPSGPSIGALLVRTSLDAGTMTAAIRRAVVASRTDLPFLNVRTYGSIVDERLRPWRLGTLLLGMFATLAVAVAAVGVFAAMAHAVAERRREMAIRLAVGARRGSVMALVLRDAIRVALAGIVVGAAGAAVGGRWIASLLHGTSPTDPIVLGAAAVFLLIVVVIAAVVPARRASLAEPGLLLRP